MMKFSDSEVATTTRGLLDILIMVKEVATKKKTMDMVTLLMRRMEKTATS